MKRRYLAAVPLATRATTVRVSVGLRLSLVAAAERALPPMRRG